MRILVAGASGAIGSRLVAQLVDHGHEVIGTHRNPANADRVSALGAVPVELDLLDPGAVRAVVLAAAPDAIVHQATALSDMTDFKHFDRSFAQTNRLRTEGTDALLAAADEAGVRPLRRPELRQRPLRARRRAREDRGRPARSHAGAPRCARATRPCATSTAR